MRALDQLELVNLRRKRAGALAFALFREIDDLLPDDIRRDVYDRMARVLHENGAHVMTDKDRAELGLEPRDFEGWTPSERVQEETRRHEATMALANLIITKQAVNL